MKKARWVSILFLAVSAHGQIVSVGVKAGVPASTAFQDNPYGSYVRRYIIGPTAEVHLPFHLAFEVDALYRRSGYDTGGTTFAFGGPPSPPVQFVERAYVNDWQVPFLAKWEPGHGPIRPFVDAGVTYRHLSGQSTVTYFSVSSSSSQAGTATTSPNMLGGTIGGGVTLKLFLLRVSPEIRYTHWASQPFIATFLPPRTNANQVDFLVGFTF